MASPPNIFFIYIRNAIYWLVSNYLLWCHCGRICDTDFHYLLLHCIIYSHVDQCNILPNIIKVGEVSSQCHARNICITQLIAPSNPAIYSCIINDGRYTFVFVQTAYHTLYYCFFRSYPISISYHCNCFERCLCCYFGVLYCSYSYTWNDNKILELFTIWNHVTEINCNGGRTGKSNVGSDIFTIALRFSPKRLENFIGFNHKASDLGNDHLTWRGGGGGGYGFFSKKIFWFPMLLKKIFWFWWRKKKIIWFRVFVM